MNAPRAYSVSSSCCQEKLYLGLPVPVDGAYNEQALLASIENEKSWNFDP